MPSDRSRRTDRPRHGYTGVVAQQGRVILDRDFNAGQGLTAARIAADALDFVGPCGTPDNGFQISLPGQSPPAPPFWSPPVTPPPESPPITPGGAATEPARAARTGLSRPDRAGGERGRGSGPARGGARRPRHHAAAETAATGAAHAGAGGRLRGGLGH